MECALSEAFSLSHQLLLRVASELLFVFAAQTISCLSHWDGEDRRERGPIV